MGRLFEIIRDNTTSQFTEKDLPLSIGGPGSHIQLPEFDKAICLIGEIDGYLFLQPLSEQVHIFHNHERVSSSVWIKSGDHTRIEAHELSYTIHGDIVTIKVDEAVSKATKDPVEPAHEYEKRSLPELCQEEKTGRRSPLWMRISLLMLALLVSIAVLLLASLSIEIDVSPKPDSLSVVGFLPVFKLGDRFLAMPGRYEIHAVKKGYRNLQIPIQISSDQTSFSFKILPLPGKVDINSKPEGAKISIDGKPAGLSPLKKWELEAGNHTIVATKSGYKKLKKTLAIEGKGIHQYFNFTLEPAWGTVRLSSRPKGALIWVDDKETGLKSPAVLKLPEGRHHLSLRLPGYETAEATLNVVAGESLTPGEIVLQHAFATVAIISRPNRALVAVDGVFKGKAPLEIKLKPEKAHRIVVSKPGYKSGTRIVKLSPDEPKKISFKLTPQYSTVFVTSPPQASLFIDGKKQKQNQGRFLLLAMPHDIEIRMPDGRRTVRRITPLPESTVSVDLRLRQQNLRSGSKVRTSTCNLILFQAGSFIMGSSRREPGRRTNEVRKKVILTRPFYLSEKEVTNAQYRRFQKDHFSGALGAMSLDGANQPVVNVSWLDAVRYLNWLSIQEGLKPFYHIEKDKVTVVRPLTTGYRLPTEAEWAWAARFAKRKRPSKYVWNGPFPPTGRAGNFADESARQILSVVIDGYNDSFPVTSPVGSFTPNPAGLFDIGGNVSEWCHDFYSPTVTFDSGAEKDPLGPKTGTHHVFRGASWKDSSITELRLSYRGYSRKGTNYIGFRIARYAR